MDNWLITGIARVLKERRHLMQLSIAQAANLAGVEKSFLLSLERGSRDPDIYALNDICAALQMSIGDLFNMVYVIDCERLLVLTSHRPKQLKSLLSQAHRDVIVVLDRKRAQVSLTNWRTDALLIDSTFAPDTLNELGISGDLVDGNQLVLVSVNTMLSLPAKQTRMTVSRVLPADTGAEVLQQAVNNLLTGTRKGRVCELRRRRDELIARRLTMAEQRLSLSEQRLKLAAQITAMSSRQIQIGDFVSPDAMPAEPINYIAEQNIILEARKEELEKQGQDLNAREAKIAAQEKANQEVMRFLKRHEIWLEESDIEELEL